MQVPGDYSAVPPNCPAEPDLGTTPIRVGPTPCNLWNLEPWNLVPCYHFDAERSAGRKNLLFLDTTQAELGRAPAGLGCGARGLSLEQLSALRHGRGWCSGDRIAVHGAEGGTTWGSIRPWSGSALVSSSVVAIRCCGQSELSG